MSDQWSLANTNRKRKKINLQPDYQRPAVWSTAQKQLLIDTFLRGYDVPKIYLDKDRTERYTYDVVDGQQRLTAIFEFFAEEYALDEKAEPVMVDTGDGIKKYEIAGKKYSDLDEELLDYFNDIQIDLLLH